MVIFEKIFQREKRDENRACHPPHTIAPPSGDTTPCRMAGVTSHSHIRCKEIGPHALHSGVEPTRPGSGFEDSGSDFGFRISGFWLRVSGHGISVQNSEFVVQGKGLGGEGSPCTAAERGGNTLHDVFPPN